MTGASKLSTKQLIEELKRRNREASFKSAQPALQKIGRQLKAARLKTGMAQNDLALMIGVTRPTVIKMETAKDGQSYLSTIIAACGVLGVRFSDIVKKAEEATAQAETPTAAQLTGKKL